MIVKFRIDAIIPTLNAELHLEKCLKSIRNMEGTETINIVIIDGGSRDSTLEIAKEYGCEIIVRKGMFSNGINGARNYGLKLCKSDYYWQVDSDNEFLEKNSLIKIMEPFENDPTIQISVPIPAVYDNSKSFPNFLVLYDLRELEGIIKNGHDYGDYIVIDDLDYGLSNGSVIKKHALDSVGGYDFDIRTLTRLRINKLSKSSIVRGAHYQHYSTTGILDYIRKLNRRTKLYSSLLREKNGFIVPINYRDLGKLDSKTRSTSLVEVFSNSLDLLSEEKNLIWIWGLLFPSLFFITGILSPISSFRTFMFFMR